MKQTAIITGITGQDGSYLAEDLLEKDIRVFGGIRRSSSSNLSRIAHLIDHPDLNLIHFDLMDGCSIENFVRTVYDSVHTLIQFDNYIQVYNLAAQSHVGDSFNIPTVTHKVNALGVITLLESLHKHFKKNFRFYQASTSELYGNGKNKRGRTKEMTEETPFNPVSPYAVSKMCSFLTVKNYREAYGIHAVNGILFNHESPRRGLDFVTRKITNYVARYALNKVERNQPLQLGNIRARRDWGDAREYVRAMDLMINKAKDETVTDYVVATGDTYSVKSFAETAFRKIGVSLDWSGTGERTKATNRNSKEEVLIEVNKNLYRPIDINHLLGNPAKIEANLQWKSTVSIKQLVSDMVDNDIEILKHDKTDYKKRAYDSAMRTSS